MNIIDKLLHNYENRSLVIKLKARFLLHLLLLVIIFTPFVIFYSAYAQKIDPAFNYTINWLAIIPPILLFFSLLGTLILLVRGHFISSAHITAIIVFASIWTVIFIDQSEPIKKLDTTLLIIGFFSAVPILISKKKYMALVYGAANLLILCIFILYIKDTIGLSDSAIGEYLSENMVAFLFSAIVAYNLLSINNQALDDAERSNAALLRSNEELQSTTEELTASNEELEAQNEELLRSEEEKNVLIREIHHRVKNNMQIISSLLNMQADAVSEPSANQALKDAVGRIHSMASIHEKIYTAENFSRIDMGLYIDQLAGDLTAMYSTSEREVEINYQPASVFLTIDRAIPTGLIINEILTNSIKHGYQEKEQCRIDMSIEDTDGQVTIMIKDYGPGMKPELFEAERKTSMGMQIIDALAKQIGAVVDLNVDQGTRFTIRFPKEG
ncbi:MAG: ATP-binding protein [Spirochaetes bacterium]|nr:ATP-binding protein [Spirochaetota bacterium]